MRLWRVCVARYTESALSVRLILAAVVRRTKRVFTQVQDPDFARQMPLAESVMHDDREVLRSLADCAPGLRAFFRIIEQWSVRDEDVRTLLGGVANEPYYAIKKAPENQALDADTLLRISYVIGIFKALHISHSKSLANEWVRLPNANRIFGGATPLAYMLSGGIPAMQTVRKLLDAQVDGV